MMPISFDGFVQVENMAHNVYPDNVILVHTRRNFHVFYLPALLMRKLKGLDGAERVDLHFDNNRSVIFDFHNAGTRKCIRTVPETMSARISASSIIRDRFVHMQKFSVQEIEQVDDHVYVLAVAEQQAE